jgi:hypothetical protein
MPATNPSTRLKQFSARAAAPALVVFLICLLFIGASTQASAGSAESSASRTWGRCSGHPREIRRLQVSRLACSAAVKAVKRGRFDETTLGRIFSTPGFTCRSQAGPKHRLNFCGRRRRAFRFVNE